MPPIVVGLGELLWDCFGDSRTPGGAPANFAYQANQLGCQGVVCSRVGQDPLGDEIRQFLEGRNLSTDFIQRDPAAPTGTVTVETSPTGEPSYTIHEDVAWDRLECTPAVADLMGRADAVCFGTLAQRTPDARAAVQAALDATRDDCLVVFDVNLRQHYYDRDGLEKSLNRARVVKLNEHEVATLGPLLFDTPLTIPDFAARLIDRFPVQTVCVTRGGEGCYLAGPEQHVDLPGTPVDVVDTVGSGDGFTAALIATQLRGWNLQDSARFANRVGGLIAGSAGAMGDLIDRYTQLYNQFEASDPI